MNGLRILEGEEEAATIAKVREIIAAKPRVRDVAHWERGWRENYEAFKKSGDITDLRPKYVRENLPLRYNGKFAVSDDPAFEWHWYERFRDQLDRDLPARARDQDPALARPEAFDLD